tara:strand:- start:69 stop:1250 length:1182 start_codon:yes stop_codon:yes gene_type:complete
MSEFTQNIDVFKSGSTYVARGHIDSNELISNADASIVLQECISKLEDCGGQVSLQPGHYSINDSIEIQNNVWLKGSGRGTQIEVASSAKSGIVCTNGKGVVISDMIISSAKRHATSNGIVISNSGDCQVRNVLTQGFIDSGITIRDNSFLCQLDNCKSADNLRANILTSNLLDNGRGGDFVPNLITNCITYAGGTGIEVDKSIVLNIVGCAVFQPTSHGFHIHSTSNSVLISGSRTFQCERNAVLVDTSHEINLSSNIFCWHRGRGIELKNVSWGAVNANEVIDQGVRSRDGSFTDGIVLGQNTQGVQVVGNTIFNWGDQVPMRNGIVEDASCKNNIISNNNINCFDQNALDIAGTNTLVNENVTADTDAYQGLGRRPYPDYDMTNIESFLHI